MRNSLFLISLALSSAACGDASAYRDKAGGGESAAQQPDLALATGSPQAKAGVIRAESERLMFAYSWPRQASAIPQLGSEMVRRAELRQTSAGEAADEEWGAAPGDGWEPRQHSYEMEWQVVADLPRFLSLSGEWSAYSGGAHGIYGMESLVWDREQDKAMEGINLFRSPAALGEALGARLCEALDRERGDRRGEPVEPGSDDMFDNCPAVDEAVVLLGSSNRRTFDRIGIYFGPYVAGPYAEGAFELNFPVDASVLDVVRPQYRAAFSIGR